MRRLGSAVVAFALAVLVVEAASRALWSHALVGATPEGAGSAAANVPRPPRVAPPGPAYDDDTALPAKAEPTASYTMRAVLDEAAHIVRGEGTIAWKNASRVPQSELWVHLYLNAFASSRSVYMRTPRGGFRGARLAEAGSIEIERFVAGDMGDLWPGRATTSPGDPEDETDIRVPLPRAIAPGESVTIETAWRAKLPAVSLRTGHAGSFHMVAQWFPKLARLEPDGRWAHFPMHPFTEFYADFGAYDVTIDTPSSFTVGATGELVAELRQGDRTVRRLHQDDVHDFAFAAWDGFEEARATEGGVEIRCLYPPGYSAAAAVELGAARFGLRELGAAYGRYPYKTLTIVHPPDDASEAGGMEYPTLITTGGPAYLPYTGVRALEIVTIHELGHQWFYGLVATDEHAFPFLDEGVNSYAETEAMEAWYPGSSAVSLLGLHVGLPAIHRVVAVDVALRAPIAQAASDFSRGSDYGALVYSRTATILETLSRVYGAERVRRAIGRYARKNRFAHPGPGELLAAIEESVGPEAAEAARRALFEAGTVDYSVDEIADEGLASAGSEDLTFVGHVVVRREGTLRFPVDVALHGADGSVQRVRWDAVEPVARLAYRGSAPLVAAAIDPEREVLLDDRLDDNAKRVSRASFAPRVFERATFAAATALSLVAP